jgi:hypothetical protein
MVDQAVKRSAKAMPMIPPSIASRIMWSYFLIVLAS